MRTLTMTTTNIMKTGVGTMKTLMRMMTMMMMKTTMRRRMRLK
jgi:hypothetical protein